MGSVLITTLRHWRTSYLEEVVFSVSQVFATGHTSDPLTYSGNPKLSRSDLIESVNICAPVDSIRAICINKLHFMSVASASTIVCFQDLQTIPHIYLMPTWSFCRWADLARRTCYRVSPEHRTWLLWLRHSVIAVYEYIGNPCWFIVYSQSLCFSVQ